MRGRLRGLADTVLNATEGQRNAKLHWAACRAGEMIAAGEVDEAVAVPILQEAGLAVGLTPREVGDAHRGTIASGLRAGPPRRTVTLTPANSIQPRPATSGGAA